MRLVSRKLNLTFTASRRRGKLRNNAHKAQYSTAVAQIHSKTAKQAYSIYKKMRSMRIQQSTTDIPQLAKLGNKAFPNLLAVQYLAPRLNKNQITYHILILIYIKYCNNNNIIAALLITV